MGSKVLVSAPLEGETKQQKMSPWNEISMNFQNSEVLSTITTSIKPSAPQTPKEKLQTCKRKNSNLILGLTYGLISGIFFSLCAASVKYMSDIDPGQVACYQYIAIAVVSFPMVVKSGKSVLGPEKNSKYWFLLCSFFDAVTVYLSFISFRYLPLSDATVLTSSVPVFVTVFARIFLKEKCSTLQILAIAISLAGVTLVAKVPLLMAERTADVYTRESIIGLLASLGSVATEGGVYIILRKLHDVDVFVILFNFGVVASLFNALLTVIFGEFAWHPCGLQQWLIFAVGICNFLCQLTLTKALEIEEAGPVSVMMAAGDIILAFILDMTLFHDTPDVYTIIGTFLVVSSVMLVGCKKWLEGHIRGPSLKQKFLKLFFG